MPPAQLSVLWCGVEAKLMCPIFETGLPTFQEPWWLAREMEGMRPSTVQGNLNRVSLREKCSGDGG